MADTPFSPPRSESPGYYVPAADASTQTTDEDFILLEPTRDASTQATDEDFILLKRTRDASTQTTDEDFDLLAQIQSGRNISIVTSESTVDASETGFSGCHERDDCDTVNTEVKKFSSPMDALTDFVMSSGSKSRVGQEYVQKVSTAHAHGSIKIDLNDRMITYNSQAPERSRPEICGLSSDLGCKDVSCRPLQIFYPGNQVGPNVCAAGYITMASSQQTAPSFHQLTQAECNKKTVNRSMKFSRNSATYKTNERTCEKCGKWFKKANTLNAHVMSNCDPNPLKCNICDRKFSFECYLKKHLLGMHG